MSAENLFLAWRKFKRGKGKKLDVQQFGLRIEEHIFALHEELVAGNWKHGAYEKFMVQDPKPRVIHKATVRDRIVHQAVINILEPLFEPTFLPHSWSCRKGKGVDASVNAVHEALEKMSRYGRKDIWILHGDIRRYFASINHEILRRQIVDKVKNDAFLALIDTIFASHAGGLPLGNVTSQLFGNVYLSALDRWIVETIRPAHYARYCDDIVLVDSDPMKLYESLEPMMVFIGERLQLMLHPKKIHLQRYCSGVDWLGVRLFPGGARRMRAVTRRRALSNIEETMNGLLDGVVSEEYWQSVAASYHGVFQRGFASEDEEKLDVLLGRRKKKEIFFWEIA